MHSAQFLIEAAFAQKRPPFVKEDFHRAPHSDPTSNDEALARYHEQASRFLPSQQLARNKTGAEKHQANEQAGPPSFSRCRNSSVFSLAR